MVLVLKFGTNVKCEGGIQMIVMNLEIDNLFGFEEFELNFSYPKKIVNSSISNEYLENKPNFRYKKINILIGANASGKTSIGRALMVIFNFISKKDPAKLREVIRNKAKKSKFSIDFLSDEETLYRINCEIDIENETKNNTSFKDKINKMDSDIYLDVFLSKISKNDSYESCIKKFKKITSGKDDEDLNYVQKLKIIPKLGWLFTFPDSGADVLLRDDILNLNILSSILKTLDTDIKVVEKSKEVESSYIIRSRNGDVFIQNGEIVDKNILSSGTKMGINIAYVVSSICENTHGFYYCDEQFSFIQTDLEQSLLSLMISLLKKNSQLFFTSHNLDLLDLELPVHSFTFLKKCTTIEVVHPEKIIKKNDISLRNAVINDVFSISPDISKILELEDGCMYEEK